MLEVVVELEELGPGAGAAGEDDCEGAPVRLSWPPEGTAASRWTRISDQSTDSHHTENERDSPARFVMACQTTHGS